MGVAIVKVQVPAGHPFVDSKGGHSYELAAAYLAGALAILLVGPGRFSLDACLFGRRGWAVMKISAGLEYQALVRPKFRPRSGMIASSF
jgi:hypothetical protein